MTRSLICVLTCSLLACAPALAQTSQPAQPDPSAAPPAQAALAKAWKKARAAKVLQARLLDTRYFVAKRTNETFLVKIGGKQDPSGVVLLEISLQRLSREQQIVFAYELDSDGQLRRFSATVTRISLGKTRTERGEAVLGGGQAVVSRIKDGKARRGGTHPWPADALPMAFTWFVVPSLFDMGIGKQLRLQATNEERVRRVRLKPTPFARLTEAPKATPKGKVHQFKIGSGYLEAEVLVEAEGPKLGQVRRVKIGRTMRDFRRVTVKEAKTLLATAPLYRNEAEAVSVLQGLQNAQEGWKHTHNAYATKLEDLKDGSNFQQRIKTMEDKYLVVFRAIPDGSKWLAIAVPVELGKTGRQFFVLNQDGALHASKTKLDLTDDCTIPKAAKPYP